MTSKNKQYFILAKCYDRKGRLISAAFNSYTKTHPLQAHFAKKVGHECREYLHAEIAAILRAKGKLIHRIQVERYGRNGQPLNSKPCPICQEAILAFGIPKVSYTTNKGFVHDDSLQVFAQKSLC